MFFNKKNKTERTVFEDYKGYDVCYYNHCMSIVTELGSATTDHYIGCLEYVLVYYNYPENVLVYYNYPENPVADLAYIKKVEKEIEEIRKTYKTYLALITVGYKDEAEKVGEKIDSLVSALLEAAPYKMTPAEYEAERARQEAERLKEAKEYLESIGYKLDKK